MLLSKNRVIRRRAVVGLLIVASLVLLSLSYRQGSTGAVGDVQRTASSVTAPASSVAHRITQPFADAYNWTTGLIDARDRAEKVTTLQNQVSALLVANKLLTANNAQLSALNGFRTTNSYDTVGATVVGQSNAEDSMVVIDHGTSSGLTSGDPVVAPLVPKAQTQNGKQTFQGAFVGVTGSCTASTCQVRLITSTSGVGYPSQVLGAGKTAQGILKPSAGTPDIFDLSLVPIAAAVNVGDIVTTASIRSNRLQSRIPAYLPIGRVLQVSNDDAGGSNKQITVEPFADFQSLGLVDVIKVPQQ